MRDTDAPNRNRLEKDVQPRQVRSNWTVEHDGVSDAVGFRVLIPVRYLDFSDLRPTFDLLRANHEFRELARLDLSSSR